MTIDDFCRLHAGDTDDIGNVVLDWHLDDLLDTACTQFQPGDTLREAVGTAAIVGDVVRGGSMLDQIPRAVEDAFVNLMNVKPGNRLEMRNLLLSHCTADDGSFLSFDNRSVMGFISKLKGQIGENLFAEHVGSAASLAASGSQEGWDVAIRQADGTFQYVQMKLYGSARHVVEHMADVQQKAVAGTLTGVGNDTVSKVFFAVPEDIRADVIRLAGQHDGLAELVHDKSIPINARNASALVTEGMSNVGPDQLKHFFGQLLCGAVAAGALHAVVNGFLWHKESKELSVAFADTVTDTLVSTTGIGVALVVENLIRTTLIAGALGIGTRMLISRVTRSRWNFADFLQKSAAEMEARNALFQQGPPEAMPA
jgi:hypothetical protein